MDTLTFSPEDAISLTVAEVREFVDDAPPEPEALLTALDQAQGDVLSGNKTEAYVLIRITP